MKTFYLITWKEFKDRKLESKVEMVLTEDIKEALDKLKVLNAQKRLTTTEYNHYNLSELFKDNALKIQEVVEK